MFPTPTPPPPTSVSSTCSSSPSPPSSSPTKTPPATSNFKSHKENLSVRGNQEMHSVWKTTSVTGDSCWALSGMGSRSGRLVAIDIKSKNYDSFTSSQNHQNLVLKLLLYLGFNRKQEQLRLNKHGQ